MTITPMQPYGRVSIIVYLVVVNIRIVDCHMYPGEPCPPSHVLLYILAEASMQYIPIYASYFPTWYHEIRVSDPDLNLPLPLLAPYLLRVAGRLPRRPSRASPRRPPSAPPGRSPMLISAGGQRPLRFPRRILLVRRLRVSSSNKSWRTSPSAMEAIVDDPVQRCRGGSRGLP